MPTIVAIGGSSIALKSTLAIDREILKLSGKTHPKLLFIPTATGDSENYCKHIQKYFGTFLKCRVDVLKLITDRPSKEIIRQKILGADIIYVGGGNTLLMMKLWRKLGVDRLLKVANKRGAVLCGVSAGSICWFQAGHSDSLSYWHPKRWHYIAVKGLGLIKGIHCPHYDSATLKIPRRKNFHAMMRKKSGMGIAIDNDCAMVFKDEHFRVMATKPKANAYKVFRKRGKIVEETISKKSDWMPISELYRRST